MGENSVRRSRGFYCSRMERMKHPSHQGKQRCGLSARAWAGPRHLLFQLVVPCPHTCCSDQSASNSGNNSCRDGPTKCVPTMWTGADAMVSFLSLRQYPYAGSHLGSWEAKHWKCKWAQQLRFGGPCPPRMARPVGVMDRPFSGSQHLSHSWLNHQRSKVPKQSGNILKWKVTISPCLAEIAAPRLVLLINLSAAGGDEPTSRQGPSTPACPASLQG